MEQKKKTLGQYINESLEKGHGDYTYEEINDLICRQSYADLVEFAEQEFDKYSDDFYIQQITETPRGLKRTIRDILVSRQTCPHPDFDQAVYKCNKKRGEISLLWVLPEKCVARYIMSDPENIDPDLYDLAGYLYHFMNGDLVKQCYKLNGITEEDLERKKQHVLKEESHKKLIHG